ALFQTWFDDLPPLVPVHEDDPRPGPVSDSEGVAPAIAVDAAEAHLHQWRLRQRALHEHAWPDDRALSIMMSRTDARSVSLATIAVGEDAIAFLYHDLTDRQSAGEVPLVTTERTASSLVLPRGRGR
ncbi:MAG: hypothetical protein ACOC0P_02360, partial [Planctomycetota bacterium]